MKYLKIYEEYEMDLGEKFDAMPMTMNEINYLSAKSEFYQDNESNNAIQAFDQNITRNFVNYQLIEKISDGQYILNGKFKCDTLPEVIKLSLTLKNNMVSTMDNLIMSAVDLEKDGDDIRFSKNVNGTEYLILKVNHTKGEYAITYRSIFDFITEDRILITTLKKFLAAYLNHKFSTASYKVILLM